MRFLLIAALLFRLVPAPALSATTAHCGEHGGGAHAEHAEGAHAEHAEHAEGAHAEHAEHAEGAHAEHAEGAEGLAHDECPHCPPADCAKHDHCPQPGMLDVAIILAAAGSSTSTFTQAAQGIESLASRADPPPVRPPLQHLA